MSSDPSPAIAAPPQHPLDAALARAAALLPSLDAAWFATRSLIAAYGALYLAFELALDQPKWAMMTALIVAQPFAGMVLSKSLFRLLGTAAGALAGLLLVALFAQAPGLFLFALAGWLGLCTFASNLFQANPAYGFALAGYTAAIVGFPGSQLPDQAFLYAVARCTEIGLGIVCASVASAVLWPRTVAATLAGRTHASTVEMLRAAAARLRARHGDVPLGGGVGQALAGGLALDAARLHAVYEGEPGRRAAARAHAVSAELLALLATARSVAWVSRRLGRRFPPLEQAIDGTISAFERAATAIEAGTGAPAAITAEALQPAWQALAAAEGALGDAGDALDAIRGRALLDRLRDALDRVAEASALQDPERAVPAPDDPIGWHFDVRLAVINGVRTFLAVLAVSAVWIWTAWPSGIGAIVFVGVLCSLFSSRENPVAASLSFAWGTLVAAPLALAVLTLVLPGTSGFPMLLIATAPLLFLAALAMAGPPARAGIGTAVGLFFISFADLSNHMAFDPAAFLNDVLAQSVGLAIAIFAFQLVIPPDPARAIRLIAAGTRADLLRIARRQSGAGPLWFAGRMADRGARLLRAVSVLPPERREIAEEVLAGVEAGAELLRLQAVLSRHDLAPEMRATILQAMQRITETTLGLDVALRAAASRIAELAQNGSGGAAHPAEGALALLADAVSERPALFRPAGAG